MRRYIFLYGTAAGLVFGKLYFPNEDALTANLAAFGTHFIGFVGRPIGAALFGHYGDRIGRKATLIATLLCMGIATFLIAFVPTYAEIGVWGAVILTVLRMLQGIGAGAESGGSVLLAMVSRVTVRFRPERQRRRLPISVSGLRWAAPNDRP
jgi:MFS family permease